MSTSGVKPLVEAAFGRKPHRLPMWFLRQAGRYLPEYRDLRSKYSFLELCQLPQLAKEVTLQPIRRYDVDAAIIFCDILIIPTGMGQKLTFGKGHGPILEPAVRTAADVARLTIPDSRQCFSFLGESITLTRQELGEQQSMIGFAGAPFTVATYMVEGGSSKNFTHCKEMLYTQPKVFKELLEKISEATYTYLVMQVEAGADTLMLFDTWLGQLPPGLFRKHVKPVMKALFDRLKATPLLESVPLIYFPGQGSEHYSELDELRCDVVAVDWRVPLDRAVKILGESGIDLSVQGNLDPQLLLADDELLKESISNIIKAGKAAPGHIFNVGHGLLPHLDPDALTRVIQAARAVD